MTINRLDVVTVGGTTIQSINSSEVRNNKETILSHGSADLSPLFAGDASQASEIRFETNDLLNLLDTEGVGINGLVLDAASRLYFKNVPEAGRTSRTAESHDSRTINQGVVYWESITLPSNGLATASVVMVASYDGTNAPIVMTGSVALPSTELSAGSYYGAGPIQINGTLYTQIQSVTINSGITAVPYFSDNIPWPSAVYLQTSKPTVSITTESIATSRAAGLTGVTLNGSTGLAVYARKWVNNVASSTQRVPSATASHLKFLFPSGKIEVESETASGEDAVQVTLMAQITIANSGLVPLTVSTSAIPTS